MNRIGNVSLTELRRAVVIKEQITALESELAQILGSTAPRGRGRPRKVREPGNGHHRAMKPGRPRGRRRGKLNAKARAKLSAAARARWAKAKAAGRNAL